ncbi:uncharacterized protein [Pagrus major]|uniref:uncharacterized protein n=1 Tax=Pagrus major TaxID=143350 RepID=UPI003CC8BA46
MEYFSKYLGINRTLSLICCMFWMFSPADGAPVSEVVGNSVILTCGNNSNSMLTQLTWKKDGVTLFSLIPQTTIHVSKEAQELNINMSVSESLLYPLIIESVQTYHRGNYTCETNTDTGLSEEKWELIITEHVEGENWYMTVIAVAVPCVCCLIIIITLTILHGVHKRRERNSSHAPTAEMHQEKEEDIYENCLESRQRGYNQPGHSKPRAH